MEVLQGQMEIFRHRWDAEVKEDAFVMVSGKNVENEEEISSERSRDAEM